MKRCVMDKAWLQGICDMDAMAFRNISSCRAFGDARDMRNNPEDGIAIALFLMIQNLPSLKQESVDHQNCHP